eukprot:TRINITY_DN23075_c0_g1_i1.p1 TRINITY_DN23075_c0_g1~~TRINITY_DN23075_c0_g1_i1.p1  ORF type:complete len:448 (+),score=75.87 TRINITY_DN23075_c0_g1_i1:406-1749(+)
MALSHLQRQASLSTLRGYANRLKVPRGKLDIEHSTVMETRYRTTYGSTFTTANELLDTVSGSRDQFPIRLPGEFSPPEISDQSAISSANVHTAWTTLTGHLGVFGTPRDFIRRINGLSLEAVASLVQAQARGLDAASARVVARRILVSMGTAHPRCAIGGTSECSTVPGDGTAGEPTFAGAEATRQITHEVTQRGARDYAAVWEGRDPGAMEEMADMLGRVADSKHVAVIDALTRLVYSDSIPESKAKPQPHHLMRIRMRARSVPSWAFDHTLVDQFDVLYWVLQPFISAISLADANEHTRVQPLVPPVAVDEKGGVASRGFYRSGEVFVYMRPAATPFGGQFYVDGVPYTTFMHHDQSASRVGRMFALVGERPYGWDIWVERHNCFSLPNFEAALELALSRALVQVKPRLRPLIRRNNYFALPLGVRMGTRPGFCGWVRVRRIRKR